MQYSLRTLFLLVLAASLLVALAKALPIFRELMLVTAIACAGFAFLAVVFQLTVKRGYAVLPVLVAVPAVILYCVALASTAALVSGLVVTGISSL